MPRSTLPYSYHGAAGGGRSRHRPARLARLRPALCHDPNGSAPAESLFTLPPDAFSRRPTFTPRSSAGGLRRALPSWGVEETSFLPFVRSAFAQKRKTLANNLRATGFAPRTRPRQWRRQLSIPRLAPKLVHRIIGRALEESEFSAPSILAVGPPDGSKPVWVIHPFTREAEKH